MTPIASKERYEVDVAVPYRLDLTVSVLRRLSTNIVDVLTPQGQYVRALIVRRMLGVDRELSHFDRAAKGVPWLRPLAIRMRGVKRAPSSRWPVR